MMQTLFTARAEARSRFVGIVSDATIGEVVELFGVFLLAFILEYLDALLSTWL